MLLLFATLLALANAKRLCFTRAEDFLPGALKGRFGAVDDDAATRRRYGNLTCLAEEEQHACGRDVGAWTFVRKNKAKAKRARANAEFSRQHAALRPDACDLLPFDAVTLDKVLAGGRTLWIKGDSTMRQLFTAFACSIPQGLVKAMPGAQGLVRIVYLKSGGVIRYDHFDDRWYQGTPEAMATRLFASCAPKDVCVHRPTLHRLDVEAEVAGLDKTHDFLPALARRPGGGWTIVLAPNVQHFRNAKMRTREGECSNGAYALGAEKATHPTPLGCAGHVCPSAREEALSRVRRLQLPLAIVGGDAQYGVGAAHPAPASRARKGAPLEQDCTHWCAPGVNDVLASMIASLVLQYDGNRSAFVGALDAATRSVDVPGDAPVGRSAAVLRLDSFDTAFDAAQPPLDKNDFVVRFVVWTVILLSNVIFSVGLYMAGQRPPTPRAAKPAISYPSAASSSPSATPSKNKIPRLALLSPLPQSPIVSP